jgi:hypothetical protein
VVNKVLEERTASTFRAIIKATRSYLYGSNILLTAVFSVPYDERKSSIPIKKVKNGYFFKNFQSDIKTDVN